MEPFRFILSVHIWAALLLAIVSGDSKQDYTIHPDPVNFDSALEECARKDGFLTTLANKQELSDIVDLISETHSGTNVSFWVGLRKSQTECIVPHLLLKGFKWTKDSSETTELGQWIEDPEPTCTGIRCALLSGMTGTPKELWGLKPSTCLASHPFICKKKASGRDTAEETLTTPGPQPPTDITVKLTGLPEPEPKTEPTSDPKPKPEPAPDQHEPCRKSEIKDSRSLSPENPRLIKVECWSDDIYWLTCSTETNIWEVKDTSIPGNNVCLPCEKGYRKTETGICVDVDECEDPVCQNDCRNTVGSFECICYDQLGNYHKEGSDLCIEGDDPNSFIGKHGLGMRPDLTTPPGPSAAPTNHSQVTKEDESQSDILIPVLIAVMCLVVLIVVVAAVVKCCLMRRSKKRAMKKAEKMAMRSKDSMENTHEKEAI